MRKGFHIAVFAFSLVTCVQAQEKTYGGKSENLLEMRGGLGSLAIIPFEDKMYMSDVDATIGNQTGLNPGELMTKFRYALVESLEKELSKDWDIQNVYSSSTRETGFGLEYVHGSVRYDYIPISGEILQANDTTVSKKQRRNQSQRRKEKSGIQNGQVVTHSDSREKYMNLIIENDTLMNYLNGSVASDYYLFITEFDIRYHITDPDRVANGGLAYRLKVHFSCIDSSAKPLVSGAATTVVEATTQNVYEVIGLAIPELSDKMAGMIRSFSIDN